MHNIRYENTNSSWDEALPLGNGHFGAMAYFNKNAFTVSMNHYDVYYKKLHMYSQSSKDEKAKMNIATYEEIVQQAIEAYKDIENPAHSSYSYIINANLKKKYGVERTGYSHAPTGELQFILNKDLKNNDYCCLDLNIKKAVLQLNVEKDINSVSIKTLVSNYGDYLITNVKQSYNNAVDSIIMSIPDRRGIEMKTEYKQLDKYTFYYLSSFYPDGENKDIYEPFSFIVMIRLEGAKGNIKKMDRYLEIDVQAAQESYSIYSTVVTEEKSIDLIQTAKLKLEKVIGKNEFLLEEHEKNWEAFWNKSSVSISDKFLESLWYINLYSLACCNGEGSILYEQACGLSGLWDIKQPTQWGSTWYWDVNIQQSFWPVYACNHLELGDAFYRGLLAYVDKAQTRAKEYYNLEGIAPDYPFPFYMTIWPWCTQYFWWQYQYSQDEDFLREKAYPLFKNVLKFFEGYLKFDEKKKEYYIFPDISPEQGPITKNSTICLACLKFLLNNAIESNIILNEEVSDREKWQNILKKLPFYSTAESVEFGKIIKDSEWAPTEQFLAHSSPLMPIYPIGEISKRSSSELVKIAHNTLQYALKNQSLGTHNFGWEACTAARLGFGDMAVSILYKKGIAFLMRTNGLLAEETERWAQNCLVACNPVYNPPLIEAGSALVSAINEMLLQSYNTEIEVFPALPAGTFEIDTENMKYDQALKSSQIKVLWENCTFKGLLAEGGFEVSAKQKGNATEFVKIKSLAGKPVNLINPFKNSIIVECGSKIIDFEISGNLIKFHTSIGNEYIISEKGISYVNRNSKVDNIETETESNKPKIYKAPSNRRVYLGKDKDTDFIRKIDGITFDYYAGNQQISKVAVYRLDFTSLDLKKNYADILPPQFHGCGKMGLDFKKITKDMRFTHYAGIGWDSCDGLRYIDRNSPDSLRRDSIASNKKRSFILELAKGKYEVFFVTGDIDIPSYTAIRIEQGIEYIPARNNLPGEFTAEVIPIVHKKDGNLEIEFDTITGCSWNLNVIIINKFF